MEIWNNVWNWLSSIFTDTEWIQKVFTFTIDIGGTKLNLFALLTLGGLLIYLGVAVVKWVIS